MCCGQPRRPIGPPWKRAGSLQHPHDEPSQGGADEAAHEAGEGRGPNREKEEQATSLYTPTHTGSIEGAT